MERCQKLYTLHLNPSEACQPNGGGEKTQKAPLYTRLGCARSRTTVLAMALHFVHKQSSVHESRSKKSKSGFCDPVPEGCPTFQSPSSSRFVQLTSFEVQEHNNLGSDVHDPRQGFPCPIRWHTSDSEVSFNNDSIDNSCLCISF